LYIPKAKRLEVAKIVVVFKPEEKGSSKVWSHYTESSEKCGVGLDLNVKERDLCKM